MSVWPPVSGPAWGEASWTAADLAHKPGTTACVLRALMIMAGMFASTRR